MKTFTYTIQDEVGIHARPAGLLAKKAKEFQSAITLEKDGKSENLPKLMAVMGKGVKHGATETDYLDATAKEPTFAELQTFFQQNL